MNSSFTFLHSTRSPMKSTIGGHWSCHRFPVVEHAVRPERRIWIIWMLCICGNLIKYHLLNEQVVSPIGIHGIGIWHRAVPHGRDVFHELGRSFEGKHLLKRCHQRRPKHRIFMAFRTEETQTSSFGALFGSFWGGYRFFHPHPAEANDRSF